MAGCQYRPDEQGELSSVLSADTAPVLGVSELNHNPTLLPITPHPPAPLGEITLPERVKNLTAFVQNLRLHLQSQRDSGTPSGSQNMQLN